MPIVLSSAFSGASDSSNSSRLSRPRRASAPAMGVVMASPVQSAKNCASTVMAFCVVSCQPVTDAMRSPSRRASKQEQL